MARAEWGLYAAVLAVLLVLVGYGLRLLPSTVVLSLDYVDGVHSVTLLQASCRGRSAASLGDNIYTYIKIINSSVHSADGVNLSVLVTAVSNESRVCGCSTVLRGVVPPGAGGARLAGSPGAPGAMGAGDVFFAAFRLDNGAVVALLVMDKYLFDFVSVLYAAVGLLGLAVAADMCPLRRGYTLGDAAIVSLGVFVLGLGLLSLFLYLRFSGFSLMLAYTAARTGLVLAVAWLMMLLLKPLLKSIEGKIKSKGDVIVAAVAAAIFALSLLLVSMSLSDSAVLLQALSVLSVGRGLASLISSVVFSVVVYGVFEVHEADDCYELRRLLASVSTMLTGIGFYGLAVYEPGAFLRIPWLWLLLIPLLLALCCLWRVET